MKYLLTVVVGFWTFFNGNEKLAPLTWANFPISISSESFVRWFSCPWDYSWKKCLINIQFSSSVRQGPAHISAHNTPSLNIIFFSACSSVILERFIYSFLPVFCPFALKLWFLTLWRQRIQFLSFSPTFFASLSS